MAKTPYAACPAKNDQYFFDLLRRQLVLVSRSGIISHWSFGRYKTLKPFQDKEGYWFVQIKRNRERRAISVSRLVWMAYNRQPIPDGHDIHHKDEDNQNNDPLNLEPATSEHRCNGTSYSQGEF